MKHIGRYRFVVVPVWLSLSGCREAPPPAPAPKATETSVALGTTNPGDSDTSAASADTAAAVDSAAPSVDTAPAVAAETAPAVAAETAPAVAAETAVVAPALEPALRCKAFAALLEPDAVAPWPEDKRVCVTRGVLEDPPRVIALQLPEVPAMGPWSPVRVAVTANGRWYATGALGSVVQAVSPLTRGPAERMFHFELEDQWLEPGAGVTTTRALHVCRVAADATAPRCATHEIARTYVPVDRSNSKDAERWTVAWSFTAEGLRFEAPKGRLNPEAEVPAAATPTFDAFFASGFELTPE